MISARQVLVRESSEENGVGNDGTAVTVADKLEHHSERMDEMDHHTRNEITQVVERVTEQRKEDESKFVSLNDAVERLEMDLQNTISHEEVEEKIAVKVRELVDQIKEALLSVEEDEADFKNVASALHGLFNSLKESKADKSEMAQVNTVFRLDAALSFVHSTLKQLPFVLAVAQSNHQYSAEPSPREQRWST